ncbi:methyltransferase domain-containing protein [Streptomyces sp. NPDC007084]|uniref:class I SAM-dependent methyltransferase n=1 Tax=Streptomyces sp. NPDC007084 TaxID=3154313 RepID=UPI003454B363
MNGSTEREELLAAHFDAFHTARAGSGFVSALYAEAMGDAYPADVAPYSSCDRQLLETAAARLQLRPGEDLADVGCGTGGVGLWLARELRARLTGLDISPAAVRIAAARAAGFVPAARAVFLTGTLEATGLRDGVVDGVVCVDALANASDRVQALAEFGRVLRPGGRAVMTRAGASGLRQTVTEQAYAAGLELEFVDERPGEPAMWGRLYRLWQARAVDLRRELGDVQADGMLREAERMLPRLAGREALVVTLRKPGGGG